MRRMNHWKRILAAAGTAALLVSNMGAVTQLTFAEERYTENATETGDAGETEVETEGLSGESGVVGDGSESGAGAGEGTESGGSERGAGEGTVSGGSESGTGEGTVSGGSESGIGEGTVSGGSESGTGEGTVAGDAESGSGEKDGHEESPSGNPEGSIVHEDGSVTWPDGTIVAADGTKTLPDGTVVAVDGTQTLPDGTVIAPDGTQTLPDGTVIAPDGTKTLPDGTVIPPEDDTTEVTYAHATRTAETENYKVSVTCDVDAQIPADAELRVTEYGHDTETYQRIVEETGEYYDWLLDISLYYNDVELEPQAPIALTVTAQTVVEESDDDDDRAAEQAGEENEISLTALDEETSEDEGERSGGTDFASESETTVGETVTAVTHFAETGTEVIADDDIEVRENEEGCMEMSFSLESLSLVAGQTYHQVTVVNYQTIDNNNGGTFLLYKVDDGVVYFLVCNNGSLATLRTTVDALVGNVDKDSVSTGDLVNLGNHVYFRDTVSGTINGVSASVSWQNLCWTRYQGYALRNVGTGAYLAIGYGNTSSLRLSWLLPYTVNFQKGTQDRYTQVYRGVGSANYGMGFDNGRFVIKNSSTNATSLTVAQVGGEYTKEPESTGGSTAVYTGEIETLPLGFYTVRVDAETSSLQPIGGVTYTIYRRAEGTDANERPNKGDTVAYVTTTSDDMHIDLPDSVLNSPGNYIMEMTSVPEGYVCDDGYWTFTIASGQLVLDLHNESGKSEGVIVVNPADNLEMTKNATVYDNEKRVYQVDLTAHSELMQGTFDALNIHLVVDQSNSMLFPSGLKEVSGTGLAVSYQESKKTYAHITDTSRLSQDKVYYVITSPSSSATVWALWYDKGTSKWTYQDASYYALATYKDEFGDTSKSESERYRHIRSSNTLATLPYQDDFKGNTQNADKTAYTEFVSGGRIVYETNWRGEVTSASNVNGAFGSEVSSSSKNTTLTIYEAEGEYNRLHYLEESVCQMLQMLAEMNPNTQVTLDGFYSTPAYCHGPYTLNNQGLTQILNTVTDITTEGGTRQDLALERTYNDHLKSTNDKEHEYVILITDGAPAGASYLGEATDTSATDSTIGSLSDSSTVYMHLNYWADKVKSKSTLATIGLSMQNVTGGRKALAHISTDGPLVADYDSSDSSKNWSDQSYGDWWFQPEYGSELGSILCERILNKIIKQTIIHERGVVTDYISDSFYPVDPTTKAKVSSGTRIDVNGNVVAGSSTDGIGTILQDSATGSWYVLWDETDISEQGKFTGRVYLKAKEDFIGGNAIDTNGNEINTEIDPVRGISSEQGAILTLGTGGSYVYERPNVNVPLLVISGQSTNVTVYKGDMIGQVYADGATNYSTYTPLQSMQDFWDGEQFRKLVSGKDSTINYRTHNAKGEAERYGVTVGNQYLSLRYAIGRALTDAEWATLKGGGSVTVPYTYDENEGVVGEFTFSLSMQSGVTGQTPSWDAHEATVANGMLHPGLANYAEIYALTVTYRAYSLADRNKQNQYNGETYNEDGSIATAGRPGKVLGTYHDDGAGVYRDQRSIADQHRVFIIDGAIKVTKVIEQNLRSNQEQTYTFELQRLGTDASGNAVYEAVQDTTGANWRQTITIPANETTTTASITWEHLKRGTYRVVEVIDANQDDYAVEEITVNATTTNCESQVYTNTERLSDLRYVTFTLGNDTTGKDVIGHSKFSSERYPIYLGQYEYGHYTDMGIFGEAQFKNTLNRYELPATGGSGEMPIEMAGLALLLVAAGGLVMRRRSGMA